VSGNFVQHSSFCTYRNAQDEDIRPPDERSQTLRDTEPCITNLGMHTLSGIESHDIESLEIPE
jgi:hypothetical protein